VIGLPVTHSLSPVMHRAAYRALGLTGHTYEAVPVAEADLTAFVAGLDATWTGVSVTMPHKRAVRAFLQDESDLSRQVGSVNTLVVTATGLHGYNTDVHGMIQALSELGVLAAGPSVVLGGGATAASALAALRDLGSTEPLVLVRNPQRALDLLAAAGRLGVHPQVNVLDGAGLARAVDDLRGNDKGVLISTLPSGAADDFAAELVAALGSPPPAGTAGPALLDVVYDPWPTPLAARWAAAGGRSVGGLEMLVHQAEGQVRLMTGRRSPIEVMRRAGIDELARRAAEGPSAPASSPASASPGSATPTG
jgi:shikimate dehydrogenase